jgi:hypothetical protein
MQSQNQLLRAQPGDLLTLLIPVVTGMRSRNFEGGASWQGTGYRRISDWSEGRYRSAGTREAELLEAGLEGGEIEAEQRSGAGRGVPVRRTGLARRLWGTLWALDYVSESLTQNASRLSVPEVRG